MNSDWWSRLTSEDRSDDELQSNTCVVYVERLFKIKQRNTSIWREVKCGLSHFFSCAFILAVNPSLLSYAGFSPDKVASATALSAGTSCVISGLFSNLPFVLAPTTSTSLYFALFLQNRNLESKDGNFSVFILGFFLFLCGLRPVALFITKVIPFVIKVGICLGVGLLIALESLTEIGLVKKGDRTVLDIGEFTGEIYIAMIAFITIGIALHYRIRGAFLIGLVLGTALYWIWVAMEGSSPHISANDIFVSWKDVTMSTDAFTLSTISKSTVYRLVFDLYIIGIILLNGLAHGLSEMAGIKREDGTLPRGKWLYAACGVGTILSSFLGSGPILISPESAPGIKSGARTGLSAVVCGLMFLLSTVLCPLFAKVPAAGTSPVLLMIGMMLFENAGKVNWSSVKEALPVFVMCVFIPFTYSIFNGVTFGFGIYSILYVCTEENAWRRIGRRLRRMFAVCCSCCELEDDVKHANSSKRSTSGSQYMGLDSFPRSGGGGHSGSGAASGGGGGATYSSLHDLEDKEDCRDLSFELNEISNQFVPVDEDELNSVSLNSGSRFSSMSSAVNNNLGSVTATAAGRGYIAHPIAQSSSSATTAAAAGSAKAGGYWPWSAGATASSSSGSRGGTTSPPPDKSYLRSINAGAGSLLSLISGSRDNTPDWVLDSKM